MIFDSFYLIIDLLLLVLLLVVLFYAIKLNKNIVQLKNNKTELKKLLNGFIIATRNAESAVEKLKINSQNQSTNIDNILAQAKRTEADLNFMVSHSQKAAVRLEQAIDNSRPFDGHITSEAKTSILPDKDISEKNDVSSNQHPIKGKSKSDLLKMLQGMR